MTRLKTLRPTLAPAPINGWKPDTVRGNRHQRGYGREWEITRKRILERDHGLCQPGMRMGQVHMATQVDHRVPRAIAQALGWSKARIEADDNLQAICDACHATKTARESQGEGAGEIFAGPET